MVSAFSALRANSVVAVEKSGQIKGDSEQPLCVILGLYSQKDLK